MKGIRGEVIVKKFSYNLLDNAGIEQIPLKRLLLLLSVRAISLGFLSMHVECLNFHQHSRHRIYIDLAVDYIMKGNLDIK